MASSFMLVMCGYFIVLPLRDEVGVAMGNKTLPFLFVMSLVLSFIAAPLCTRVIVSAPNKTRGLQLLYRGLALSICSFFILLYNFPRSPIIEGAFFVWISLLNLISVSAVWARAADVFTSQEARRLYGVVGAGATAGQLIGSFLAGHLSHISTFAVGNSPSLAPLLISAVLFELAGRCLSWSEFIEVVDVPRNNDTPTFFLDSIALILRSKYMLYVSLFMVLNYFVSSVFYFEKSLAASSLTDPSGIAQYFASIQSWSAVFILILQITATGTLVLKLGVSKALSVTPFAAGLFMGLIFFLPSPAVVMVAEICRKILTYALGRPTREILFTVMTKEEKYKSKLFIDTVVQKVGDALAAGVFSLVVPYFGFGPRMMALLCIPVCIIWGWLAVRLGQETEALTAINMDKADL